jgi:hypothetical protein
LTTPWVLPFLARRVKVVENIVFMIPTSNGEAYTFLVVIFVSFLSVLIIFYTLFIATLQRERRAIKSIYYGQVLKWRETIMSGVAACKQTKYKPSAAGDERRNDRK